MSGPWRRARPELIIAAIATIAVGLAGLALAGWPGLAVVAAGAAVLALLTLRGLAPRPALASARKARERPAARPIAGYSQRRFVVTSGIGTRTSYEADLRPVLEHLLAARLAEHHGVNLYTDPAAARAAFCRDRRDEALWRWIDPGAPRVRAEPNSIAREKPGIPRLTLARLIDRLERL